MKRKLLILLISFSALLILSSGAMRENGKAGNTGSPGEVTCIDCHSSFAPNSGGGSIYLSSPGTTSNQYVPGQTYSMSVTVKRLTNPLFGIGLEALTNANQNAGTLNITDPAATQIKTAFISSVNRVNIVHQLDGGRTNDSMVFNFSWTAPTAGTGNVTFYFAGVAANSSGDDLGDYVYNSSQLFTESTCSSPAQPGAISGNTNVCSGSNQNYSITAVSGATSYTWTLPSGWSGTSSTTSINVNSGNSSGQISITASNACGTSTASSLAVTSNSVSLNATSTNVNCSGNANGTASVNATGGAQPYSYLWSPGANTTATINNLAPGTYTVTVTENGGCTNSASVTITQPTALNANVSSTNAACFSGNGSATVVPVGGTAPYTYAWSPTGGSASTANLPAGNYTVVLTDSHGCTKSNAVTITQPTALTASVTSTNPACFSGNGTASVVAGGGISPYSYAWSPSGGSASTASIPAGNYSVVVTDSHGCTKSSPVSITQPTQLAVSSNSTNAKCNGDEGTVTAIPSGGTSPYSYLWSPSGGSQISASVLAGNYTVRVTDSHACSVTSTPVTVNEPTAISIVVSSTDASCTTANGTATANASGGTGSYSYSWSTTPVQTTSVAVNLGAGNYNVTVTDGNGCTHTSSAMVNQPSTLSVTASASMVNCNGGSDGQASLIVSGGTPGYSYSWNTVPVQTDSVATNLIAGTYTAIVSDNGGCSYTENVTITEPPLLTASAGSTISICPGSNTMIGGSPTAAGGTPGYTFSWSPASGLDYDTISNPTAQPLSSTVYTVLIEDLHNCATTSTVNVNIYSPITPAISQSGDSIVSTPALYYQWMLNNNALPGATDKSYLPLQNGDYSVAITDSNGCADTSAVFAYNTVGINHDNFAEHIIIYPNPSTNYLLVRTPLIFEECIMHIYDATGKILSEKIINAGNNFFDISEFANGLYTLIISADNNIITRRISVLK